jgi:hypothetical protein
MSALQAGTARIALEPKIGTDLVGYRDKQTSIGINNPIHARALVLDDGDTLIALCSIEVCLFVDSDVQQIRALIAERCPIPPENVFVCATHTHAAPALYEPENWERLPAESAADAVVTAYESRHPARLGTGFGQLYGYSINRRFMNRPVDPSIGVLRVDTADGNPLAILGNYGNHAVVMGYDNDHISGDWPGYSSNRLEAEIGGGLVAIFTQGGAGDINPMTETVRQRLAAGHPVEAIGSTSTLYGEYNEANSHAWNIGDRGGGTFTEAETIAIAYNAEVMRVWRSIGTSDQAALWTQSFRVSGTPDDDEPPIRDTAEYRAARERFERVMADALAGDMKMEVMLIGIGEAVLVGQPGEVFSENAIELRKVCQQMGIAFPLLVSYANGWFSYLPPENAYSEGGYEVEVAQSVGLSRRIQDRILEAVLPILRSHIAS